MSTSAPFSTWPAVRHLVGFDLRRFRVLLAASVGLELLRQGYGEWTLHLAPTALGDRFGVADANLQTTLFDTALWLLTWIVTAVLIQADHPSDDRAFWRTRPLASHAIALAKIAVLALVCVVVPAIVNAGRLAAYGAPASAHVAAVVQIVVLALGAIVPAWGLAILTRTLPRFIAAIGAVTIGGWLLFMAVLFYLGYFGFGSISSGGFGIGLASAGWARSETLGWLGALVLTSIGLGILIAHYRFRRTGVLIAAGVALLFAPDLIPSFASTVAPPPDLARLAAVPLRPMTLTVDSGFPTRGSGAAVLSGRLAMPDLPRDVSAGVTVGRIRVLVEGRDVAINGFEQCCLGATGPIGVAGTGPFVPPPDKESQQDGIALVRAAAVADLRTKPVTLDADAAVAFVRHRLTASIPFAPGAAFRGDGYIVEVLSLSRPVYPDRTAAALLRMTQFPRLGHGSAPQLTFFQSNPARTIVNRATSPYPMQARPARTPAYEWARAQHWAVRFYAIVFETEDVGPEPRLLIVESRPAGEIATRIVWDGHPAGPR